MLLEHVLQGCRLLLRGYIHEGLLHQGLLVLLKGEKARFCAVHNDRIIPNKSRIEGARHNAIRVGRGRQGELKLRGVGT